MDRAMAAWLALLLLGGGVITVPACGPAPPDYSDLPVRALEEVAPESDRVHVVKRGETLTRIARQYGVSIPSIVKRNPGLDPDRIQVGQKIVLPPEANR